MASIAQSFLFSWEKIEASSDLQRLGYVLSTLPDEELMRKLEARRGKGRNRYPVRSMWNSLIAGIVFEHTSIASLRRELSRNGELRQACGFNPARTDKAVPTARAYTSLLRGLLQCSDEVEALFDELVKKVTQLLPDLG